MTNIKEAMSERGYYVIEGAIPEDYVKIFKKTIVDYFSGPNTAVEGNTAQPNALNNEKLFALHDIFSLKSLMDPMRELLDNEVCFLHNFDVHHNFLALGWHDDTQIRHLSQKPKNYSFLEENLTDENPFKVYNLAVYLQDHPDNRALSVYVGSHKNGMGAGLGNDISDRERIDSQEEVNLSVKAGDVVVFDERLFHHGNIGENNDRSTIFFGLGAKNIHSYYSAKGSIERMIRETRQNYKPCQKLIDTLKENNISI